MSNKKQKKEALNYVQSIFYPAVNDLVSEFQLPVQKFVHQMIFGIIKSRSVIAQRIGISLEEKLKLKKTCERLYRNLKKKVFLYSFLMLSHMRKTSSGIQETTPIFLDLSDIAKPAAKKMEGLSRVWDGSEGKTNKGYYTLQASFCDPENPRSIRLYYSDLFSLEEENVSENEKILEFIHQSSILTGNKGIYVGDRGFDRERLLTDMIENDNSFIVRGDERHLLLNDQPMSYKEIAEQTKLIYEISSKSRTFKANIVEVGYKLPNPSARKHKPKRKVKLHLVIAKEKGKGYVYFLCRFRKQYSKEEMTRMAIQYYGMRWSIEEVHRQLKQDFGWEKMQLLTYTSLKNMNALLWLAASFVYNEVRKIAVYLIKRLPEKMLYQNFNKEINKNLYYRLTNTVSYLFGLFLIRPKQKYKGMRSKYKMIKSQLVLDLKHL